MSSGIFQDPAFNANSKSSRLLAFKTAKLTSSHLIIFCICILVADSFERENAIAPLHKDFSHNHIFHEGKIGALVRSGNNFWLFVADQSYESGHWTGLGSDKPEMVKRTCCTCVRVPLQLSNRVTWVKPGSNLGHPNHSEVISFYFTVCHIAHIDNVQIYLKPGRPLKFKHTFSTTL